MLTISVPLHSQNTNDITLSLDGTPFEDYQSISRVQVICPTITLDSDNDPTYFDLQQPGKIVFKFGDSPLPIGLLKAKFRVYLPGYSTEGLFWSFFQMNVFDGVGV